MTGLPTEIGQKLADRWVALLTVPGLLYVAAATTAVVLGQAHALSYSYLSRKIAAWAAGPAFESTGGTVLIAGAVLAGSAFAGLVAAAGGDLIERLWTLPGERGPARWLSQWRLRRSRRQKAIADTASGDARAVRRAIERTDRICLVEPARPTWIGDRLRVCQVRTARIYGLALETAWPRLWLIVPDSVRSQLGSAQDDFDSAARLTAWSALYLPLGIRWWPAILISAAIGVAGVVKGRGATGVLADLIEATVDLYSAQLAARLGEQTDGPLNPAVGSRLTTLMRKSRWDPDSPLAL